MGYEGKELGCGRTKSAEFCNAEKQWVSKNGRQVDEANGKSGRQTEATYEKLGGVLGENCRKTGLQNEGASVENWKANYREKMKG